MRLSTGAGGFAAAMFLLLLGTFDPTPSRAWQMDLPTTTPAASAPAAPAEAVPTSVAPVVTLPAQTAPQPPVETIQAPAPAPSISRADENCLATAVYFEAKGEPRRGQLAVAQ